MSEKDVFQAYASRNLPRNHTIFEKGDHDHLFKPYQNCSPHQPWRNLKHHFSKRRKHHEVYSIFIYIYTVVPSLSIKFPDPWQKIPEKKHSFASETLKTCSYVVGNEGIIPNPIQNLNFINVPSFVGFIISESHQSASKLLFSRLFWS